VLGYVDARTTFLPTRIVWPTLGLVALVAVAVAVVSGEGDDLRRAALGCVLYGGVFYVLWWLTPGFGFGDVRLAFLLGAVLGFLGWEELGIGFAAALFLGGFGGALLVLLKVVDARRSPYGPHMLVGAVVGAGFGPALAGVLGY
jgi:leader peptidase (prepilin peptidase)/N-methyltransferase